ncbi:MAG: sporulation protein YunB [Acutalibacteraceae bacterium]
MRRFRRRRRLSFKGKALAVLALLLSTVVLLDCRLRPVMLANACARAKGIAVQAVNAAVLKTLEELPNDYESFVQVDYGENGEIRSLQAHAAAVNRVKAAVNTAVSEAVAHSELQSFSIPLGTLSGVALLSGKGPPIACHTSVLNTPVVTLESDLTSAGINQTLHRIDISVTVMLTVTLPMQTDTVSLETGFLLAQTVLVGDVPDSYTDVISDPQMVGDIFDYADLE